MAAAKGCLLFLCQVKCPGMGRSQLLAGGAGFFVGGGILLLCRLILGGGIGAGDVKLFAILGWWLGADHVLRVLFGSFFLAAGYSLILMIPGKIKRGQKIPLAPFVLAGVVCLLLTEIGG